MKRSNNTLSITSHLPNIQYQRLYKKLLTKIGVIILLLLIGNITYGQVKFEWAKNIASTMNVEGNAIAVDSSKNIYTAGGFQRTADFDPNAGIFNLTAIGDFDIFIQKLDAQGNLLWVKGIGGTNDDQANSIAVDNLGNVYITGTFQGTVDFDPNAGIFNLTTGGNSIFVLKLDQLGNLVWAKNMGNIGISEGTSIKVDDLGNVYTTGYFYGTVDFDPNASIYNLTVVGGNNDIFIQKLDIGGNLVWAKSMGGISSDKGTSIALDSLGNVYTTGYFGGTVDFDPNAGVFNLNPTGGGGYHAFIQKLDTGGNLVWAKNMGGAGTLSQAVCYGYSIAIDKLGYIHTTGYFQGYIYLYPNPGVTPLGSSGGRTVFVQKLDPLGNLVWAKAMGGNGFDGGTAITLDAQSNIYTTGYFEQTVDFDPNAGINNLTSIAGDHSMFIHKLDPAGNLVWAKSTKGGSRTDSKAIAVDASSTIYTVGHFRSMVDFDPTEGVNNLDAGVSYDDMFVQKLSQEKVIGQVYHDFNQNCVLDSNEISLSNRILIINPGNIITTTNSSGIWAVDSLPIGSYTITVDTSGSWLATCPIIQNFTVVNSNSFMTVPPFGLASTAPCSEPTISVRAPFLRPGFSNQRVYVQACNQVIGTGALDSAYVVLELDSLLTVQSSSLPHQNLGNNQYRINIDTLIPGVCVNFWMDCTLSTTAILGQSLCMKAVLYPIDSCSLDSIPNPFPIGINPCNTTYDGSHLSIQSTCNNDSINFIIRNIGDGDMSCYSQVRLFIDGQYIWMDSVQLVSGDTTIFALTGDGRTWRLEVDQHPLHSGNSQPSTTIELCGNGGNWTSDLVTILPQDDAAPNVAIFCGLVTGSYDPNDKTGYPLGINSSHDILPNQDLEYVIRFQNTGTDTAFTVVIRDTLSTDLDIFSVQSGVSSHNYTFRMYGPRVLEWTFNNIMLPDSNVNEPNSNGFITFKVNQIANLPVGTLIENNAAIYFDFNAPIITNTMAHHIALPQDLNWGGLNTLNISACDRYTYNNVTYNTSGTYWQAQNTGGLDSLYILNIAILNSSFTLSEDACNTYTAPDGQIYTASGQYTATIPNTVGCDSTITVNLTIGDNITYSTIDETRCNTYLAPDGNVYTTSGQYFATIPNTLSCDSIITINLTIIPILVDTAVTSIGTSLFCFASNASLQWLDCDNAFTPIIGATSGIFSPTGNGNYAIEVIQNGCIDTSSCYSVVITSLSTIQNNTEWLIYPNPVKEVLFISNKNNTPNEAFIELINPLGQVLISKTSTASITEIDLKNLPSGVYNLSINNGKQTAIQKIIKQ